MESTSQSNREVVAPDSHRNVNVPGGRRPASHVCEPLPPPRSGAESDSIRVWLASLSAIMASPISREAVASQLLERIHAFCPSRQSALFCVPEVACNTWQPSGELEVLAARGMALGEDEALWVERIARESLNRCQVLGRESLSAALASFLWVPVLCRGERVAVLQFGDDRGHAMAGSRPRELGVLADDIGAVLVQTGELEAMQRKNVDLEMQIDALKREQAAARRERREQAGRDLLLNAPLNAALRRAEAMVAEQPEMAGLASDLRELRCGESAPETWVDLPGLVEHCLEIVCTSDVDRGSLTVQADRIPPVRCQRMRVKGLLCALIERAIGRLGSEVSGWIQLRSCERTVLCEVGVEGEIEHGSAGNEPWSWWFDSPEERDAAIDLAEDQGGDLQALRAEDRVVATLTLPVDPDLG